MGVAESHYSRREVLEEIAEYCRGRWVALECAKPGRLRVFIRYSRSGAPLSISSPLDVASLVRAYRGLGPRTFYGSVCVYRRLSSTRDLEEPGNIAYATPVWDVDGSLEEWELIVEAAGVIVGVLEEEGVRESVYLLWSGEGVHVRIHERAFSGRVLERFNPLDVAYAVVEYVLRRARRGLEDVAGRSSRGLKVENLVNLKRVFTAPLSLHRRLDLCCVCFKPGDLDSFDPSWADPKRYRHDKGWGVFVEGEGDELALKALREVGGYPGWRGRAKITRVEAREEVEAGLGRFQVMALLQAARYYLLKGDLDKAKSFGLNRAIFYAWAKHRARTARPPKGVRGGLGGRRASGVRLVKALGDEEAPVSESGWFAMGGVEQRPEDYDRHVAARVDAVIPYEEAWRAALDYLKGFSRKTLLDPQEFYRKVYLPVRDDFVGKVVRRRPSKTASLDELLGLR